VSLEPAAIEVEGLLFEYPGVLALAEVSCRVARGSVTALVGPNGAGKTTLMRCVAGLERPTLGTIRVAGVDVLDAPREAHRRIGFLSDFYGLYDALTVRQCLAHAAASHGLPAARIEGTVAHTADRLDVADKLDARAGELSRGQRQRVAIGQALVHAPEVLILDEPAAGLDPEARSALAHLFKRLQAEGMTLVVSSHILAELDEYSTDMLVLRHGKVIEQRALRAAAGGGSRVRIGLARETTELRAALAAIDGVRVESVDGRRAVVHLAGGADAHAALLAQLVGRGLPVVEFGAEREDLQASYLRTVQHGGNA
jgi:ABC-2 type transport system ATP-binding protein